MEHFPSLQNVSNKIFLRKSNGEEKIAMESFLAPFEFLIE
jgi:hypothetical protein